MVTQFLYDGDALVIEYNGSNGQLRRYVHGDQVDEPWVEYSGVNIGTGYRTYLHADHQGSIIARTDGSGNYLTKLTYDSFGIPGTSNTGRFGYTGQIWLSQLGLFHYKARMYSPKLGRFLQTDPIFYADNMNMYAYVGNDPVNMIDPTGMSGLFPANYQNIKSMYGYGIPGVLRPTQNPDFSTASGAVANVTAAASVFCIAFCLPASPVLANISASASITSAVTNDNPGKELAKEAVTLGIGRKIDAVAETVKAIKNLDETGGKMVDTAAGIADIGVNQSVDNAMDNSANKNNRSKNNSDQGMSGGIVRICGGVGAEKGWCND